MNFILTIMCERSSIVKKKSLLFLKIVALFVLAQAKCCL